MFKGSREVQSRCSRTLSLYWILTRNVWYSCFVHFYVFRITSPRLPRAGLITCSGFIFFFSVLDGAFPIRFVLEKDTFGNLNSLQLRRCSFRRCVVGLMLEPRLLSSLRSLSILVHISDMSLPKLLWNCYDSQYVKQSRNLHILGWRLQGCYRRCGYKQENIKWK